MDNQKLYFSKNLNNCALLLGYNPEGICIYTCCMPIIEYYETNQPWDCPEESKAMRLHILHGYLFNEEGKLIQEFQSQSSIETGLYISGWSRDEDGILTHD